MTDRSQDCPLCDREAFDVSMMKNGAWAVEPVPDAETMCVGWSDEGNRRARCTVYWHK